MNNRIPIPFTTKPGLVVYSVLDKPMASHPNGREMFSLTIGFVKGDDITAIDAATREAISRSPQAAAFSNPLQPDPRFTLKAVESGAYNGQRGDLIRVTLKSAHAPKYYDEKGNECPPYTITRGMMAAAMGVVKANYKPGAYAAVSYMLVGVKAEALAWGDIGPGLGEKPKKFSFI